MRLQELSVDSLEVARTGKSFQGQVNIDALPRLADMLASASGSLSWSVRGEMFRDAFGAMQAGLVVAVSGELQLLCQRCLRALPFDLANETRLQLIAGDQVWSEDADDESLEGAVGPVLEPLVASATLSLFELVEDEVLLALPIAPRHEGCDLPEHDDGRLAASPFAGLARLKMH